MPLPNTQMSHLLFMPEFSKDYLSASLGANPTSTQVILVRHGRSTWNDEGRFQGSSDQADLTLTGRQTARQVGLALRSVLIAAVYASPLQRVQQTVRELLSVQDTQPPLYLHPDLREVDLMHWEGLPYREVQERFADEYACWQRHPDQFQIGQRFPVLELYDRAQRFWQQILSRHAGQTILIVGHGGSNHALISTALGLAPAAHHTLQQSNSGISVLHFPDPRPSSARLDALNMTYPLGEVLPKLKAGKSGLRLLMLPSDRLTDAYVHQVAQGLTHEAIDFSLTIGTHQSPAVTQAILSRHPQAVQLQVFQDALPQSWHRAMEQRSQQDQRLITGLMIAPHAVAHSLVCQAISIEAQQLHLAPQTLSVLHYPSASRHPILQALNQFPVSIAQTPLSISTQTESGNRTAYSDAVARL